MPAEPKHHADQDPPLNFVTPAWGILETERRRSTGYNSRKGT